MGKRTIHHPVAAQQPSRAGVLSRRIASLLEHLSAPAHLLSTRANPYKKCHGGFPHSTQSQLPRSRTPLNIAQWTGSTVSEIKGVGGLYLALRMVKNCLETDIQHSPCPGLTPKRMLLLPREEPYNIMYLPFMRGKGLRALAKHQVAPKDEPSAVVQISSEGLRVHGI